MVPSARPRPTWSAREPTSRDGDGPASRPSFAWAWAAALVFGGITTLQAVLPVQGTVSTSRAIRIMEGHMAYWLLWAVLTPAIGWVWRSQRVAALSKSRRVSIQGTAALAFTVCHSGALYLCQRVLGLTDFIVPLWQGALAVSYWRLAMDLLVYASIVGVLAAIDATRRSHDQALTVARLNTQLAESRLRELRMQLNPHFLFNTLHTVTMSVRRGDGDEAVRVVAALGDLLRAVLAEPHRQTVTLREELAVVERYLSIERARLGERLRVSMSADIDTLDVPVPSLAVQHLVENAMHHGLEGREGSGQLDVRVRRAGAMLVIEVADDGAGPDPSRRSSTEGGGGLANTIDRLALLYGTQFDLELKEGAPGAVATLRIPSSGVSIPGSVA